MLIVMILAVPLLGASVLLLMRSGSLMRKGSGNFIRNVKKYIPAVVSAVVLVLGCLLLKSVFGGDPAGSGSEIAGFDGGSVEFAIPFPGPYRPTFHADAISAVFTVLAAFVWFAVSIYTPGYMKHEERPESFDVWTMLTLTAVMGIFLAGDMLTMLLFFELMTIASYFWVIHRWDRKSVRSGYLYLFFSLAAGFLVTLGIVMTGEATGSLPAIGKSPVVPADPRLFSLGIVLFILGFGIKAGVVPLHIWLPHAHSAAPTPASALLSGLLIKVGAYGLIRVGGFVGWRRDAGIGAAWLGPVLTTAGVCAMLAGVVSALLQSNAKRLLAYHSISQMGYIIFGLGIGLCLGTDGYTAVAGAVYHVINHALFKAALFLGVGIIYTRTQETNLYRLGGLWRRFPATAVLMLVAVLGITGAPGLNGYASKTLLHHAAGMAAETGSPWLVWAERLFVLTGVGTAASFAKLYYLIFIRKPGSDAKGSLSAENPAVTGNLSAARKSPGTPGADRALLWMQAAIGLLAAAMVIIGTSPEYFAEKVVIPAAYASGAGRSAAGLAVPVSLNHGGFSFWAAGDMISMVITLLAGVLVCFAGLKSGIFHWKPPVWLTEEGLGKIAAKGILLLMDEGAREYHVLADNAHESGSALRDKLYSIVKKFDRNRSGTVGRVTISGISADAALLFVILAFLIIWYIAVHPDFL